MPTPRPKCPAQVNLEAFRSVQVLLFGCAVCVQALAGCSTGPSGSSGGGPSDDSMTGGATGGGSGPNGGGSAAGGGLAMGGELSGTDWPTTEERIGRSCGKSNCHGGKELLCLAKDADRDPNGGTNCDGGSLYDTLRSKKVSPCGNVPLVNPGNPEQSALLMLVKRQCGSFVMPDDCPPESSGAVTCWPEEDILQVGTWIENGALQE
jgi:hypothetical protein